MKRLRILVLMLFLTVLVGSAQNISVKSFQLLETDLTANLEGTKEIDQNGEVAALIKVITTETGFMFDLGMLGIVRQVQHPGEIWLYVPHGVQRISINHQRLGRLKEPYYFQIPVQAARTYELVLTTSRVKTIVEEDAGGGFLVLHVNPASAIVLIDDKVVEIKADGSLTSFLLYGDHTYRIQAPGYKSETGTISITSEETKTLDITLQSTRANVTFTTDMDDAEIWVNNELKGTGRWTGTLDAGAYIVETRKAGCRPQRTTITVSEQEERTVTLNAPIPIVGKLRVESDPMGADVLLAGKQLGQTPGIFSDVPVGTHTIRIIKDGYEPQTVEAVVEEGKIASVSATLTSTGEQTAVQPQKPKEPKEPRPQKEPKPSLPSLFKKTGFHVDADYLLGSPSAVGASVGAYLSNIHLEVSYALPLAAPIPIYYTFNYNDGSFSNPVLQSYKPSSLLGGSVGYGIPLGHRLRLTPGGGADVLSITAPAVSIGNSQQSYVFSGAVSLRTDIALTSLLSVHVTPAYRFVIQRGTTAERLSTISSDLAGWNNGFSLRAGISLNL